MFAFTGNATHALCGVLTAFSSRSVFIGCLQRCVCDCMSQPICMSLWREVIEWCRTELSTTGSQLELLRDEQSASGNQNLKTRQQGNKGGGRKDEENWEGQSERKTVLQHFTKRCISCTTGAGGRTSRGLYLLIYHDNTTIDVASMVLRPVYVKL